MERKPVTIYLHGSKETMYDKAEELGLSEKVIDTFKYAAYEVELDCYVETDTGEVYCQAINNMLLKEPVKI